MGGDRSSAAGADLSTVLDLARALAAERDLDRLLAKIVAAASSLVGAERSTLFVVDPERGELWSRVAEGASEIRLPLGRGIAGAVAASGEPVAIPDAYADPRFDPATDQRTGFRTRSILCVPLTDHEGRVVGALQALNKRDGQAFDAHDADLLTALAAQAGVALVNAQLVQRDRERLQLRRDMELARSIQRSLWPEALPEVPGWRFAAWAETCDATGGDYYDAWGHADGSADAVVGDVSGHGIGAALLMSSARAALRALRLCHDDPVALVERLDRLLYEDLADDAFMTLVLARFAPDGALSYVSAGHDPPLVWRRAARRADALASTGLPLGMLGEAQYGCCRLPPLDAGDAVVLFSDGISEAQDASGALFTVERLREVLAATPPDAGPERMCEALVGAVRGWLGGRPPHDDMTLLVAVRT